MATITVTPPAAAPAATPSTPTPASAPTTPAATTPTPAAPATQTPTTPSEPLSMGERLQQGWEKAKASVPLEETPTTPAEVAPVTPEDTAEVVTQEPAEVTEPAAETTETPTEEEFPALSLDDAEPSDPAAFAEALKADEAASKFFNDHPEWKGKVFGALRRDSENREIRQYVPDVETAKMVTTAASTFQTIDNKFLGATTPEGAQSFLDSWVREAMILGEDGKPLLDAAGKYQMHPSLPYIFNHIFTNKLSVLAAQADKSGDERLQAAVGIIKEVLSPSSSATGEVPDELKPYADSLKAKEEDLRKREEATTRQAREAQEAVHTQSIDRAENKAADSVRGQLKQTFDKAGLTEFERNAALREIGDAVDGKLGENNLYQSIYDSILLDPPSEAREKRLTKHVLSYTNEILGPIVAQVIRQAKGGALDRQAARQTKVDTQKKASATDPRGTSITPSSPQNQTPSQLRSTLIQEYKASHGGEDPDREWLMAEGWKRMNAQPRR